MDKEEQDKILPETLAAAGVAMIYCARKEVWPDFSLWASKGETDDMPGGRQSLLQMIMLLDSIITEVETEVFSRELSDFLNGLKDE